MVQRGPALVTLLSRVLTLLTVPEVAPVVLFSPEERVLSSSVSLLVMLVVDFRVEASPLTRLLVAENVRLTVLSMELRSEASEETVLPSELAVLLSVSLSLCMLPVVEERSLSRLSAEESDALSAEEESLSTFRAELTMFEKLCRPAVALASVEAEEDMVLLSPVVMLVRPLLLRQPFSLLSMLVFIAATESVNDPPTLVRTVEEVPPAMTRVTVPVPLPRQKAIRGCAGPGASMATTLAEKLLGTMMVVQHLLECMFLRVLLLEAKAQLTSADLCSLVLM